MKRLFLLLGGLLSACSMGGTSGPTGGGRPDLPTNSRVSFPAALGGDHLYLSLLDEGGHTVYQLGVPGSASSVSVSPGDWTGKAAGLTLHPASDLLPTGATDVTQSDPTVQGALLSWTVWRDVNTNGQLDPGEALPLMTHDVVIYATAATTVRFRTSSPDTQQTWTVTQGWSRGEHYVYLPKGSTTYLRSVTSSPAYLFSLHTPTPDTSM